MYSLPAHTVHLTLQYISPLTDPIPLHLVSTPLRQRHHFLQISTSSPVDYLCWPSPDNAKIIGLLDHLPPFSDHISYPTRYTSDPDSTFAHVQISFDAQGLRLIFHWDDNTWKYHDLRLMPFPSSSFLTPQESLAADSAAGADTIVEADKTNSDNDDPYWAAYGEAVDALASLSPSQNSPDIIGEDAYWAQYTSIQGSADSTVPSPLPTSRKLQPVIISNDANSLSPYPPQDEPIIDAPVDAIHFRPRLGPPSPNALAHLLSISARKDACSPVPNDRYPSQSPSTSSTHPSLKQTIADSELVTLPLPDEASIVSPVVVEREGETSSKYKPRPLEKEDKALTESIKGLYYLWKSGRRGEPDVKDRDIFLQIVHEAVA